MAIPRQSSDVYRRRAPRASKRKDLAIQVEGLSAFRRALKDVSPDAEKEFRTAIRNYGKRALAKARTNSPIRSGALRKSIKLSVTNREGAIYSNSPYANAHEWGTKGGANSQVRPRGVPIEIPRSQMIGNAVYFYRDSFGYEMANLVNKTARANGIETGPTVRQSSRGGRIIDASN